MASQDIWSEKKAAWYTEALTYSTYPSRAMEKIRPRLKGINSVLDVGAGTGSLSIPLAKLVKRVTALEPSRAMSEIFKKRVRKAGLDNITLINAAWGQVPIGRHDALLVANVPCVLNDVGKFVAEARAIVKKSFFLISGVGGEGHKFLFDELYPLIFRRQLMKGRDYVQLYTALHSLRICADVEIFCYRFDQKFDSLDEAVEFWKAHLNLKDARHDATLKDFLAQKLYRTKGGYLLHKIRKRSALLSWRV